MTPVPISTGDVFAPAFFGCAFFRPGQFYSVGRCAHQRHYLGQAPLAACARAAFSRSSLQCCSLERSSRSLAFSNVGVRPKRVWWRFVIGSTRLEFSARRVALEAAYLRPPGLEGRLRVTRASSSAGSSFRVGTALANRRNGGPDRRSRRGKPLCGTVHAAHRTGVTSAKEVKTYKSGFSHGSSVP